MKFEQMLEQLINKQDSFGAEELLVEQIKRYPKNVSLLLKLCMTRINDPIEDGERALACIEEINKIDTNNFYATMLEYCIYDRIFGAPENIDYDKLEKVYTCNKEQLSIIKYLMADYMYFIKDNKIEAIQLLKKSIELGSDFVSNYSYDYDSYLKACSDSKDLVPSEHFTAIGLMVNKTGVC